MTHKQKVLRLLSDRKPHSHHELYQLGCVAHSRISDLRRDGYRIEQWRENDLYLYRLVGSALNESSQAVPPAAATPGLSLSAETDMGALEDASGAGVSPPSSATGASSSALLSRLALPQEPLPAGADALALFDTSGKGAYGEEAT